MNMMRKIEDRNRISRFLSYILRHNPGAIDLRLDSHGWIDVNTLIDAANRHGKNLNREIIEEIVTSNDKKRFALSADGMKIRANQGHSIEIDLALTPVTPPKILYHGTAGKYLRAIKQDGIKSSGRHHVHLSVDRVTAEKVGKRHGKPVVISINTEKMWQDGAAFYRSANGVWLTDYVDPSYFLQMYPLKR